ncbi:MAG: rhodanese-like domain-containing protein [Bacteroidetes bacterium]|nr:rhodanese-like domain-containing protein [Bacteroidota bacterium]
MISIPKVSPREAYAGYMLGAVIVDVRNPSDVAHKSIDVKRFVNLPFEELGARFSEIPGNKPVVFLSRIGLKGHEAVKFMLEHGYENVAALEGGLSAWEEEGLPVKGN